MRKIVLALLVLSLLVPLYAKGAKDIAEKAAAPTVKPVTLRVGWWGNPTRDERTLKVIDLYMKKYPNVTIEPETVGWAGYWDRINTQVAAGNLPDVMQHDYAYLLQFVGRNLMSDLTDYLVSKTIDLAGVPESFISGGRVNGRLYGVNLGTNAVTVIYDPAILAKAGVAEPTATWTWADFEKMAVQIFQKTGVQTLPFFTTDPKVGFDNWIRQTGSTFFAANGKALGFTDQKQLEAFWGIQLRLADAGALVNPETAFVSVTAQEGDFAKGRSWVQYVWSNQVISEQAAAARPVKMALLPRIAEGYKRPGTFLKPSMFFSVPAMSKNKDEAAKFINYFISDPEATGVLLGERGVPIIASVRTSVKAKLDAQNQAIFDYIDLVGKGNASPLDPPDPAVTGEILKGFRDVTQGVLLKKYDPAAAAAEFMKQANALLAK